MSVYENCKSNLNQNVHTEEEIIIDHEFSPEVKNGVQMIHHITSSQSIKDLTDKKIIEFSTSKYNSEFNTNDHLPGRVKGGNPNIKSSIFNPINTEDSNNDKTEHPNEKFIQPYDVQFESGVRQPCCSGKNKCIIY